jgi:hypothetical protein
MATDPQMGIQEMGRPLLGAETVGGVYIHYSMYKSLGFIGSTTKKQNKTKQKVGDPDMVARLLSQLLGRVVFAQELDTSLGSTVRLFQKANRK